VIRSYRDRKTQRFSEGERIPRFEGFRHQAEKRLRILESAVNLRDLAQLPGNRLEALSGDRQGQYSIQLISSGGSASSGGQELRGQKTSRSSITIKEF